MSSSCIVREFPVPNREYRAAPPERWDDFSPPPPARRTAPRRSRRRRQKRRAAPLALAGLILFCSGFLMGQVAAALEAAANAAGAFVPEAGAIQPEEPGAALLPEEPDSASDSGGVRILGVPGAIFSGASSGQSAGTAQPGTPSGTSTGTARPGTPSGTAVSTDWNLILVNGDHPLPEDFQVPELTNLKNGHAIDSRAYPSLQAMMDGARAAGFRPTICSSFRTWDKQSKLFENKVASCMAQGFGREEAERQAAVWVARPGTSEHQAGLAVDIVDIDYQLLDQAQEDRPVQRWLMEHCAEYGFILRYPTDKSALTGVGYEPWHYRYVGEEAARAIMDGGLCLEEYLAK